MHPPVNALATLADKLAFEADDAQRAAWQASCARSVYQAICQSAQVAGDDIAITYLDTPEGAATDLSYRALAAAITQAANFFGDRGGQGCGVAYVLPALPVTHVVLWGAEACGYAVPLNPFLQPEEIVELVRASGARFFVYPKAPVPGMAERVQAVRQHLPQVQLVAVGPGPGPAAEHATDFEQAIAAYPADRAVHFDGQRSSEEIVAYFHTGGTTGLPKLVAHHSRNQLSAALGAATLLQLHKGDILTNGMPLFHVGGTIASSLSFFLRGARILILSPQGFRNPAMVQGIWKVVERFKVTALGAVPTAMGALLNVPVDADIRSLRWGLTGSSPCPRSVTERFKAVTGVQLHELLGMTETGGVTAADPVGGTTTAGSVGFGVPFTRLRVRRPGPDQQLGEDCAVNEVGVLFVQGDHVSPGYLDAAHSAGVFVEGGLNSGDLAYVDEDGKLFIAGRSKDLIIRSGHNIDPGMIEEAFTAHPDVALAAAVGQPDAYAGELPAVFVAMKPGASADVEQLQDFARQRIAERPAWPKAVYVLETMPVTAVGKIFKPDLRAEAAKRLLREQLAQVAPQSAQSLAVQVGGKRGLHVDVFLEEAEAAARSAVEGRLQDYLFSWTVHQR